MGKKSDVKFKIGDVVRVTMECDGDVYGAVERVDIVVGASIPPKDDYSPYYLVKSVCGKIVCARGYDLSPVTHEELDAEIKEIQEKVEAVQKDASILAAAKKMLAAVGE